MSVFFIIFSKCRNFFSIQRVGIASALCTSIPENFWTEVAFKVLLEFPVLEKTLIDFVKYLFFIFVGNFTTDIFKILYLL